MAREISGGARGLALVEAVAALPAPERLHARVGIATGLVVVGNLAAASPEHEVVGEAPNLRPIWW